MKDKIYSLFLSKEFVINEDALKKYVDFCLLEQYDGEEYSELHHILIRKHFPEFEKDSWNIVRLRYEDHIKAHELLADALPEDRAANCAHFFMKAKSGRLDEKLTIQNSRRFIGDRNPSKRDDVRRKISESKRGKVRADMKGKSFFGASEDTIAELTKKLGKPHEGMVPVRLPDGKVIKVKTDDPRYIGGELKCIIGAKKGQPGPISDPVVKAKFKQSIEARKQKFASMPGEEIASYCYKMQAAGKTVFKNGKLTNNYGRLFGYANLNPEDFIQIDRQGSTTIESQTSNLVDFMSE